VTTMCHLGNTTILRLATQLGSWHSDFFPRKNRVLDTAICHRRPRVRPIEHGTAGLSRRSRRRGRTWSPAAEKSAVRRAALDLREFAIGYALSAERYLVSLLQPFSERAVPDIPAKTFQERAYCSYDVSPQKQ
jgi:hypothetical protein